jgi:hypothetical protein
MSANPQMMAQMLASQLGGQQAQPVGGMQPQASALGGAAQMAQKIMLMRALQGQPQPGQPPQPGMPPNPTTMGAPGLPGVAAPQQMNQAPMPGGVNA